MRLRILAAAAAAAIVIPVTAGTAAYASAGHHRAADPGLTAVTSLTNRPDSGAASTWATDTVTRTLTLTLVGTTGSGPAEVWDYTASVQDSGSFQTISGALTPNQSGVYTGLRVLSSAPGSLSGGAAYSFTASAPADMTLVPASEGGAPVTPGQTTSLWFEQAFPAGTVFGGPGIGDWSWSYSISPLDHHLGLFRHWTDASDNGAGDQPADGNINV